LRANHYYLHHIFHTSMLELDLHHLNWTLGMQYAMQFPDRFQEELPYAERYIQPEENGQVLSGKLSYNPEHWQLGIALTRAFDSGRFLFPKELGRDHFYTSIPRSRLEGLGDAQIFTLMGNYDFNVEGLKLSIEFTEVLGPGIEEYEFNKYNIDEYYQINGRLHYALGGFLEGLHFDLLYIYKENLNNSDPRNIFNASNFHQISFVTNYVF